MEEKLTELLTALGLADMGGDPLTVYVLSSVRERLLNETNLTELPDGLACLGAELALGELLRLKKSMGLLDIEGRDLDAAVKSIQEGDTNITFASGEGSLTPEQRLDVLIARLTADRSREILRYRRLVW